MGNQRLDQYKQRLSPQQIAAGMNAARENAARLARDAEILLEAERFPSAAALAVLSIEEVGKISILRGLAVARDDQEVKSAWRAFRSHTKKNAHWMLPELVGQGARSLAELAPLYQEGSDHPYVLDQVKQIAFYTDCLGDAHWSSPPKVVTEPLARSLVRTAILFSRTREVTVEEVQLWVKHVGPAWRGPMDWMKKAVLNWYEAMKERGLLEESAGDMASFLYPGDGSDGQQRGTEEAGTDGA